MNTKTFCYFLLLFVISITQTFAQDSIAKKYYSSGKIREEIPYKNGKISGEGKYYRETGELWMIRTYKKGVLEDFVSYYKSGKVQLHTEYKDDKKNGKENSFYESGKLESERSYTAGELNGLEIQYYENGTVKRKTTYIIGKREGVEMSYYDTGVLEEEISYKNDKRDGITKQYEKDGTLILECNYINGQKNGKYKYYSKGELYSEGNYLNDEKEGVWIDYCGTKGRWSGSNCKIHEETIYSKGIMEGIQKSYYSHSGKLEWETTYKNGKKEGVRKRYYEDGKIKKMATYVNDMKEGTETEYFETGKIEKVTPYKNDKREGIEKSYYENGKVEYETPYVDDKREGVQLYYSEGGKIINETPYKNDYENGVKKRYYETGKVEYEINYTNGKYNGIFKEYWENGNLKSEIMYEDGTQKGSEKKYPELLSARDSLNKYISDYNYYDSPTDEIKFKILDLTTRVKPLPTIPEEAREMYVMGITLRNDAKNKEDYNLAIGKFQAANKLAPWWADVYKENGLTLELAGKYYEAISEFNAYLKGNVSDEEKRKVQDEIYICKAKNEKSNIDTEKKRKEAEQHDLIASKNNPKNITYKKLAKRSIGELYGYNKGSEFMGDQYFANIFDINGHYIGITLSAVGDDKNRYVEDKIGIWHLNTANNVFGWRHKMGATETNRIEQGGESFNYIISFPKISNEDGVSIDYGQSQPHLQLFLSTLYRWRIENYLREYTIGEEIYSGYIQGEANPKLVLFSKKTIKAAEDFSTKIEEMKPAYVIPLVEGSVVGDSGYYLAFEKISDFIDGDRTEIKFIKK